MSTYAEIDGAHVNPSAVTHIIWGEKDVTVHFIGGGSLVVTQEDAFRIDSEMHGYLKDLESIAETLEHKLTCRLDDIITELHIMRTKL